jgi:ribonuclease VapC
MRSAATTDLMAFLEVAGAGMVPVSEIEAAAALDAFAREGRLQSAQLNPGDCFAYAVAKNRHVFLLFKGDDFSNPDIATGAY